VTYPGGKTRVESNKCKLKKVTACNRPNMTAAKKKHTA